MQNDKPSEESPHPLERRLATILEKRDAELAAKGKITTATPPAKDVRTADRFDGTYTGRMCSKPPGFLQKEKCWPVPLKIEYGKVQGTWLDRKRRSCYLKGTVSADGSLSLTLQGWRADGKSVSANMSGKIEDKIIKASGYWESGYTVNGSWEGF